MVVQAIRSNANLLHAMASGDCESALEEFVVRNGPRVRQLLLDLGYEPSNEGADALEIEIFVSLFDRAALYDPVDSESEASTLWIDSVVCGRFYTQGASGDLLRPNQRRLKELLSLRLGDSISAQEDRELEKLLASLVDYSQEAKEGVATQLRTLSSQHRDDQIQSKTESKQEQTLVLAVREAIHSEQKSTIQSDFRKHQPLPFPASKVGGPNEASGARPQGLWFALAIAAVVALAYALLR